MTCVVGIEHGGAVWLAGDSAVVGGSSISRCREPKVRRIRRGLVMGIAGGGRETDLAMGWRPPRGPGRVDPYRWIVDEAVPWLHQTLARDGYSGRKAELELLIGIGGRLFSLEEGGGCWSPADRMAAIGDEIATALALGSLSETERRPPEFRLRRALRASCRWSTAARPPWTIVHA